MPLDANDNQRDGARRLSSALLAISDLNETILQSSPMSPVAPVRTACEDIQLIARFIDGALDLRLRNQLENDEEFVGAFERMHATVPDFTGCLFAVMETGPRPDFVAKLTELAAVLRRALANAVRAFVAAVDTRTREDHTLADDRKKALQLANDVQSRLNARQLVHEAEQALIETRQARDETREAADETKKVTSGIAADSFGNEYQSYAERENTTADRLRVAVAALAVAVAGWATWLTVWTDEVSLRSELLRLSVAIPLAVLASYLARESSKHRAAARGARDLAVAMHTVEAYAAALDDETSRELRRVLGLRAFGPAGGHPAAREVESTPDSASLVDRLMSPGQGPVSRP